jgi:hypothetical protein
MFELLKSKLIKMTKDKIKTTPARSKEKVLSKNILLFGMKKSKRVPKKSE